MKSKKSMKRKPSRWVTVLTAAVLLSLAAPVPAWADEAAGQQAEAESVAEAEIDAYYNGAVLVGDSVMKDFRNYSLKRSDTFLGGIRFLAAGCFSIHNSLWPVSSESVHPIYQGQQRPVWESLGMMEAKRIFLFFGLNDMNMGPLDETCEKYLELIGNIKSACPDAEIHLMSMTYAIKGKSKGNMNNDTVRDFNGRLQQMASENGWGYVNLVDPLSDGEGNLRPEYCSDYFVHQTTAAYDVWTSVLREYAASQLDGTAAYPIGGKQQEEEAEPEGQPVSRKKATGPASEIEEGE